MHYTLHLTNNCNMACRYCYVDHENITVMKPEISKKVVDLATQDAKGPIGIVFFGGEPLLHKDLIKETIEYCKWKERQQGIMFYFKVTTNGLLLDEKFMELSAKENIFIALSHDGVKDAHDKHRIDRQGKGTFDLLSDRIDLLLKNRPYAPVLMTVNPDTVMHYCSSVIYLYEKGFRYIICSLNYSAPWTEADVKMLKKQYAKLAEFYFERTLREEKFYLSPFEVKISSHINGDSYCHERCELGKKQISVSPDGFLFPCVQFVGDDRYSIGSVDTGINKGMREKLYVMNEGEKESCKSCVISKRCNHFCGCLNKQSTGSITKVSPVLCSHERILLPIADKLAEKLYKRRSGLFIQKHYNDLFPLLSLIEDNTKKL